MAFPTSDENYSEDNAYVPEVSAGRVAEAAWDLGVGDRETSVISKMMARDDLSKAGEKLSPEKINEQYPGLNADREMTLQEAQFVFDDKKEREEKEKILSAASGSFLKGTVLPFVAGAGSAMADPLGFAVGAFTGWGLGKAVTSIATKQAIKAGAKAGTKITIEGARKFALDVTDNAIGNSISEALIMKDKEQSFEEYTAADFLKNAIAGSVIMTGAIHGGAKAVRTVAKFGDKHLDSVQRMTDTLVENGKNPEIMNEAFDIMDNVVSHTPESKGIIESNFGDRVELGEDMADAMSNIKKAHEDGKITDSELVSFKEQIEKSEVDDRAMDVENFRLTDEEVAKIDEKIKDPSTDIGYNTEASKVADAMEGYDPEARLDEISTEVDEMFGSEEFDFEGNPIVREDLDPEMQTIKTELDNEMKLMEAQDAYLKCRIG